VNGGANYELDYTPVESIKNKTIPLPIVEDLSENHPFGNYYNNGIKKEIQKVQSNDK